MPRKTYKKRTYKKRVYKNRRYKKRFYRRKFYKPIKRPEIHIVEDTTDITFNDASTGVGNFINLTRIGEGQPEPQYDDMWFSINNKRIDGRKIRLKYLYIKGYIKVSSSDGGDADDFNCKLMVFRWKRNTSNSTLTWGTLVNNPPSGSPSTWSETDRLNMMYKQDWKNDIKVNFSKRIKNLYRKYDDANNIIPFKIRIPLYECVLTCDTTFDTSIGRYSALVNPSTNGIYFTLLSNKYDDKVILSYKYKLYYTDY